MRRGSRIVTRKGGILIPQGHTDPDQKNEPAESSSLGSIGASRGVLADSLPGEITDSLTTFYC